MRSHRGERAATAHVALRRALTSLAHLAHLARRFAGSLRPGGPSAADQAWVRALLSDGEAGLWARMSGPDRRHAVMVARAVGGDDRDVLAAALLHDVGKVDAGLGTFGRVGATLLGMVARERFARGDGRVARYLRHDAIGAELLATAGAPPLVVAWAREHHLPAPAWTVPRHVGERLKAADDD